MTSERRVEGRGVSLAVREHGDHTAPTVVLVHGWPDTQRVWDEVVEQLRGRYHVVTFDLRGFGGSTQPREPGGYRLDRVATDLRAVIDAVSPGKPAHVVAHDWGSIMSWEAVTTPGIAERIASFTSISGPSLDQVRPWIERGIRKGMIGRLLRQGLSSWYIYAFRLPFAPLVARRVVARGLPGFLRRVEGIEPREGHPAPTIGRDASRGVALYRQNVLQRMQRPRDARTSVPVQLIVPTLDVAVSPALLDDVGSFVDRLWRRRVRARHWVIRSHPQLIARMVTELVDHIEGAAPVRALVRARTGKRMPYEGHLVVVTGAGSGIGRATALAFAERGAEVVAADIDLAAATRTAELAGLLGRAGRPFEVDVSDRVAMEAFAKDVLAEVGVPDIVVNNAGIGLAGPFLDTGVEDWERILDVNLWGVIHGSRLFGKQMAEAGEGGHIVNVASAAAYLPSRQLPAYSTSKAAVLMLSQCMRAELVGAGIGVSAICPGLVNTSITRTARFVGLSDEEQRRRRRLAARIYERRNFGPERVAAEILRAVRTNAAIVPVTPEAKATYVLSRAAPSVLRALARVDVQP